MLTAFYEYTIDYPKQLKENIIKRQSEEKQDSLMKILEEIIKNIKDIGK